LIIPVVQALIKNRQKRESVNHPYLSSIVSSKRKKTPLKRREPAFMQRRQIKLLGHKIKHIFQRLAF